MNSAFSNYIYSAAPSLDENNNIIMDLDIGALGIKKAVEQSELFQSNINLFNLKELAQSAAVTLITDGSAENIQMKLTYSGLGSHDVELSKEDKNDLFIHSTVLLKQSPKQWINEQINKSKGIISLTSTNDKYGNDTTIANFMLKTNVFANISELAKDRKNAAEESSDYPFRHYEEKKPHLPPVDYTVTEIHGNNLYIKAEFDNHKHDLVFDKRKLQGQDIGHLIFNMTYGKTLELEYENNLEHEETNMSNYLGIEGLHYTYRGDYSDPAVSYKGIIWSDWEVLDTIENFINEDVEEGIVPEGTEVQDWVKKEGNAEAIKSFLDECIVAQQTEDRIAELKDEANKKYSDVLDTEFCVDGWYDISKWAAKTDDNFDKLFEKFNISSEEAHKMASDYLEKRDNERLYDFVYDFLSEHTDSSDLIEIAKDCGIKLEMPCMIYLQNGCSYDTVNMNECANKLDKLHEEYSGLHAVVFNAEGTIYSNMLTETAGQDFRKENGMPLIPKEKQSTYEHTNDI